MQLAKSEEVPARSQAAGCEAHSMSEADDGTTVDYDAAPDEECVPLPAKLLPPLREAHRAVMFAAATANCYGNA